ncbi:sodium/hydrogen exchanger 9B2-like isoform X3 [Periplaneta americana]|uniref:sodium/hydrogen exchanger 9B2-like isoform X3 n=1 Tax=Periplaneta americana TaxID=6978 RepID=UPI0037E87AD6
MSSSDVSSDNTSYTYTMCNGGDERSDSGLGFEPRMDEHDSQSSRPFYLQHGKLWGVASRALALGALGLVVWGVLFSVMGSDAGPGGQLFRMGVLFVVAHLAGCALRPSGLPPLLGMLLVGILLRNVGFLQLSDHFVPVAANLRKVALVVILIRAGLGLDPAALKRLSWVVLRLSLVPSVVEATVVAFMAHGLLGLPLLWGFLLGCVLAAVSPAVVIPCLCNLQDKGYGKRKGIPTLVMAAASIDDINAISAFGIVLGIIFSQGSQTMQILQGPLGLLIGLLLGVAAGLFLRYIPDKKDSQVVVLRTILLGSMGLLLVFGVDALGYTGAGPLGCIVAAFVASHGWTAQDSDGSQNSVSSGFVTLWVVFQPVLFGLIGTEINLSVLEAETVGLGIACLSLSLVMRMVSSAATVAGVGLNWKEKLFVAIAWFPKATVQAAIGPLALDAARGQPEAVEYASIVLTISVLAILITAPIGAVLITTLGPRLLQRERLDLPRTLANRTAVLVHKLLSKTTDPAVREEIVGAVTTYLVILIQFQLSFSNIPNNSAVTSNNSVS